MPKKKKKNRYGSGESRTVSIYASQLVPAIEKGLKYHRAGVFDKAGEIYRQVIADNPGSADAHHYLGVIANQTGQYQKAIPLIRKALALAPANATAHYNLGVALDNSGQNREAVSHYEEAIRLKPDFVTAYKNLGVVLHRTGQIDRAIGIYEKALSIKPDYADVYSNLANSLVAKEQMEEAIETYGKALSINPGCADTYNNLGVTFKDAGQLEKAVEAFNKAIGLKPDFAEAYNNLGNVYGELNLSQKAVQSFEKAVSINPGYHEPVCNLGVELRKLGLVDEAVRCFEKSLALKPDYVEAMVHLVRSVTYDECDDTIAGMEALYSRTSLPDGQKVLLGFSLGKVFEDLNNFEKAFAYINEANRLKRSSYAYSIDEDRERIRIITDSFDTSFFDAYRQCGHHDSTPVFILGMPRSGTSLLEQILASHSMVFGAGELKDFSIAANRIEWVHSENRKKGYIPIRGKSGFEAAGVEYINRIRTLSTDAKFITDKMPHNFLNIGLIKACLPDARIIHCIREPMDTCFSIFKNDFSEKGSHRYACSQEELGEYYRLYTGLMSHWRDVLPGSVYDVRYEDLVSDLEGQSRALLEFIGLPWEKGCLDFHKTRRRVSTASAVQVRRPVYRDSIGLWKRYEQYLEPLMSRLSSSG
ncbi:MAG: tetratricopeptide repeat protein [Desulfobacterales bacterium]|nr:tetratricopeptide repeat protein [Desulfobacterales bacterium]